jgi:hypothetical protein
MIRLFRERKGLSNGIFSMLYIGPPSLMPASSF